MSHATLPLARAQNRHTDHLSHLSSRVLVIDDNEAIHSDFRKTLSSRRSTASRAPDLAALEMELFDEPASKVEHAQVQFEVDCANQGEEGYRKVVKALEDRRPYSTAFVDMRMPPGWDGVETIEHLWRADPELQVVICSAYSDYSWAEMVERLGASDRLLILKKTFDQIEACQMAAALGAKRVATSQARLKLVEMESLVQLKTDELKQAFLLDKLTGLPNRELLNDRLNQLLRRAARDNTYHFAVLFLDFDRFKIVNDSLGHEIGDLLLIEISARLTRALRTTDTVAVSGNSGTAARLGGDEFIVVLDQLRDPSDAARIAQRILDGLSAPYHLKGHLVYSTASVGVTNSTLGYKNPEEMIRDADIAMYRAKAAGKAQYVLFDGRMHDDAMARLTLENDLRRAIDEKQFFLQYQPIVCLETGLTASFEALVRWKHPTRGLISPLDFIPLAEEIGVIVPLGFWVLSEACRQLAEWRSRRPDFASVGMSVNLSRKQLGAAKLVETVGQVIRDTGLSPSDLKLEITESTIMEDAERGVHVLEQIRQQGIHLHMDDFGTGYSSLSCLHRFPINGLKIDRSFITSVSERRDYAAVVNAIVSLTHNLGIQLVAEGVETLDQAAMLQSMGCEFAQGYLFSRPLDAEKVESFVLKGWSSATTPAVSAA